MDRQFPKGFNVKSVPTKYGEIIKIGISKDDILTNTFNENGWLNIDIKTSKSGNKFAEISSYKKNNEDDLIPF